MCKVKTDIVKIAIVYHSGFGHTARQAEAVKRGVEKIAKASTLFLTSEEAQSRWDDLTQSDAIIFGAPTYMGSASAQFKAFMDATSKLFFDGAWKDKIAAGFTNSASRSGDKLETLIQFAILAAQHGMHWVNLGLPPGNNHSKGAEQDLNRLGFFLGAGAQSNADEGPEVSPPQSDLLTAEYLGERVAQVALQFARGRVAA
jgi:multimeric flavodoxin WrbA